MKLLSNLFKPDSNLLDPRISHSLFHAANSVINGAELTLTSMGRCGATSSGIMEKHNIKRVDRLLGNPRLQQARTLFYRRTCELFTHHKALLIHVDWSTVYNYNFVMLRAAVSIQGRAITLYEEVHPEERHTNHQVHKQFLAQLARLLPRHITPIICTDAGFKVPWFKLVEHHGWNWLGRTRGTVKCQTEGERDWKFVHQYHTKATRKATELSELKLSKSNQYACRGVLFQDKAKGRHKLNRKGITTQCNSNKNHARAAREPWFLVSNLDKDSFLPHALVNLYRRRMAIEETFRDTKNEYYGLGLSRSLSRDTERLQIILLIAMLVQVYLYSLGKAAESQGLHKHFQANTISHRRVLSYGYLALRIIKHPGFNLSERLIMEALLSLIQDAQY